MREVELVFTKSRKKFPVFSWLIRLWTWKSYSHIARKLQISFLDEPCYFQANDGKINWEYHRHFAKKHKVVKRVKFELSNKEYLKLNKLCWEQAGDKYGLLQNLGIAVVDICKLIGINICNPWKQGQNCSEVIYRTIIKRRHPELKYNPDTIKPHHIERILKQKGYKIVEEK